MAPDPVNRAATSLAMKMAKLAPSARKMARFESACPDMWFPVPVSDRKILPYDADTQAKAHVGMAARHFLGRPYVRLVNGNQGECVRRLTDIAGPRAIESARHGDEAPRREVEALDIAWHGRDETAVAGVVGLRTLRAVERVGEDLDFTVIGEVTHLHDTAAPDDVRGAIAFRLACDLRGWYRGVVGGRLVNGRGCAAGQGQHEQGGRDS